MHGIHTRCSWSLVAFETTLDQGVEYANRTEDTVGHEEVLPVGVREHADLDQAATDRLLGPLARLYQTARQEIDRHVKAGGRCAICRAPFPCERAVLAEMALASF
jgi:hypothetical protein